MLWGVASDVGCCQCCVCFCVEDGAPREVPGSDEGERTEEERRHAEVSHPLQSL